MEADQFDRTRATAGAQQPGPGPAGLLQEPSPRLPASDAGGGGGDESAGRTLPPPTVGGGTFLSSSRSLQTSIFPRSRGAWWCAASGRLGPSAGKHESPNDFFLFPSLGSQPGQQLEHPE